MFGGTIIARHVNDILCCVNVADFKLRYNIVGICNDILCCVNRAECVWRYNKSGIL